MIGMDQVLAFAIAASVLIALPGPSVVFVIGRALAYGRAVALASVAGNSLGLLMVITLVAFGLGAIVSESQAVFTALRLVGAAYLVWLGIRAIRDRSGIHVGTVTGTGLRARWLVSMRQGFVVGVSNPKAFMIFAALLPQFADHGRGHLQLQMFLLGLVAFGIGLVTDTVWALTASGLRDWFNASERRGRTLGAVGGASMVGLGVGVGVSGGTH